MIEEVKIPTIKLLWSDSYKLEEIKKNVKDGGINVPDKPGVYQVIDEDGEILHIGRALSLRRRVKQGFVKGKNKHFTRKRMLENGVDLNKLKIQWAVTEWPNSVEEFLHKEFRKKHKRLPKFTKIT